ncbi:hypothetical protein [Pseudomonas sp. PAMC 25886]|jgi:hypothetical protein|uniref:hypothetical protein n=1 Tax=Pseudomonas sp. PAMC 25886 TaxID=1125977 RepID=UPI0015A6FF4D|nr:hypothetical protein [Pseudomonas sp. PAMC 25886]
MAAVCAATFALALLRRKKGGAKPGSTLKIWNVWKSASVMNAWVGNAGIHVSCPAGKMTLECSNGVGDADFSDYVVALEEQQCGQMSWLSS